MKTRIFSGLLILSICFLCGRMQGQDWDTGGNTINGGEWLGANPASDVPVRFEHRADDSLSRFEWHTHDGISVGERMRLTRLGWLGLNTTSPLARYHQNRGDFLITGRDTLPITPTVPDSGFGSKFMWIESRSAFRAGSWFAPSTVTYLNSNNIGAYSVAIGHDNLASGPESASIGSTNQAIGNASTCIGSNNTTIGGSSFAYGNANIVNGDFSVALGLGNNLSNSFEHTLGRNNILNGSEAWAIGTANNVDGLISGSLGKSNAIDSVAPFSFAMGCFLHSSAPANLTLGNGTGIFPLLNSEPFSMMVGFNSDVPTLFVDGGDGTSGSFGDVGIGNITDPTQRLDVNGTARLRIMPDSIPLALITGAKDTATDPDGDYVLNYLLFNGDNTTYLSGNGTWEDSLAFMAVMAAHNGCTIENDTVVLGNVAGDSTAWLLNDREIPMHDFNLVFTTPYTNSLTKNRVGIGTNSPVGKLHIETNQTGATGSVYGLYDKVIGGIGANYGQFISLSAPASSFSYGIFAQSQGSYDKNWGGYFSGVSSTSSTSSVGVQGVATQTAASAGHFGVIGQAANGYRNTGVLGSATANNASSGALGVQGLATTSAANTSGVDPLFAVQGVTTVNSSHCGYSAVGVYGEVIDNTSGCDASNTRYGVFGKASTAGTNSWAGFFSGDLFYTGAWQPSDESLKSNIEQSTGVGQLLQQIPTYTYEFTPDGCPQLNFPEGKQFGVLAQEVQSVFPDLVSSMPVPAEIDEDGNEIAPSMEILTINTLEFIPILIQAHNEQAAEIAALKDQLNACCSDTKSLLLENDGPVHEVELKSGTTSTEKAILYQNTPNPTNGECTIRYYVPSFVGSCEIHFFDTYGNVIKVVSITSTGMGQLHIEASDLSVGSYTYALVVDGTIVATRMMVKQ